MNYVLENSDTMTYRELVTCNTFFPRLTELKNKAKVDREWKYSFVRLICTLRYCPQASLGHVSHHSMQSSHVPQQSPRETAW